MRPLYKSHALRVYDGHTIRSQFGLLSPSVYVSLLPVVDACVVATMLPRTVNGRAGGRRKSQSS